MGVPPRLLQGIGAAVCLAMGRPLHHRDTAGKGTRMLRPAAAPGDQVLRRASAGDGEPVVVGAVVTQRVGAVHDDRVEAGASVLTIMKKPSTIVGWYEPVMHPE